MRQFALDLGLPKVDVDKLVGAHMKNFEALTQTAQIATDSVKPVAAKQRETIESAFREAVEMARSTELAGDPKEMLAKQTAAVNRALNAAVGNTRDVADRIQKANADAFNCRGPDHGKHRGGPPELFLPDQIPTALVLGTARTLSHGSSGAASEAVRAVGFGRPLPAFLALRTAGARPMPSAACTASFSWVSKRSRRRASSAHGRRGR